MGWENKSNVLVAMGKKQVVSSDGSTSSGGWQRRYNTKSERKESPKERQTEFYQSNIDRSMYEEVEYRESKPPKVVYVEKPVPVQQPAPPQVVYVQQPAPVQLSAPV